LKQLAKRVPSTIQHVFGSFRISYKTRMHILKQIDDKTTKYTSEF